MRGACPSRWPFDLVREGGFKEYFNPLTGEGYGAKTFSWTAALVVDLIRSRAR